MRPNGISTLDELSSNQISSRTIYPDSNAHGANMGPTWVLSAPDGPHVGPTNFAIRVCYVSAYTSVQFLIQGTSTLGATMFSPHTSFHQHSEAVTRWLTFDRRQFEFNLLKKNVHMMIPISVNVVPGGHIDNTRNRLCKGLVPNRWQAVTGNSGGSFNFRCIDRCATCFMC